MDADSHHLPTHAGSQPTGETVYQARWLIPDGESCLSPGCLQARGGRIMRVWEGTDAAAVDLGEVAILPGLINAHTHLEFSDCVAPLATGGGFPDWIRAVIQARRRRPAERAAADVIRRGWEECRAAGTAAVGEIATELDSYAALAAAGGCGVVYREVLGLHDDAVAAGLEAARTFLRDGRSATPPSPLRRGVSPHAPYSLHPQLFRGLIQLAVETGAAVAMHLAESREELELLAEHRGGLVDLLASLGLWRAELFTEYRRPLDYLRALSRCRSALVVHGNYLADDELDFLATQPQMTVVYCPRTQAAFGHEPHPWLKMQQRGIRVVLGTDSRASNPDLSLLPELRRLHQQSPHVPVPHLLRMATCDAAAALGLTDELGSLSPGLRAEFTCIRPARPLVDKDWSGLLDGDVCVPPVTA